MAAPPSSPAVVVVEEPSSPAVEVVVVSGTDDVVVSESAVSTVCSVVSPPQAPTKIASSKPSIIRRILVPPISTYPIFGLPDPRV
jgi:hypothetical protein